MKGKGLPQKERRAGLFMVIRLHINAKFQQSYRKIPICIETSIVITQCALYGRELKCLSMGNIK